MPELLPCLHIVVFQYPHHPSSNSRTIQDRPTVVSLQSYRAGQGKLPELTNMHFPRSLTNQLQKASIHFLNDHPPTQATSHSSHSGHNHGMRFFSTRASGMLHLHILDLLPLMKEVADPGILLGQPSCQSSNVGMQVPDVSMSLFEECSYIGFLHMGNYGAQSLEPETTK